VLEVVRFKFKVLPPPPHHQSSTVILLLGQRKCSSNLLWFLHTHLFRA
jgi:hypothetical protein